MLYTTDESAAEVEEGEGRLELELLLSRKLPLSLMRCSEEMMVRQESYVKDTDAAEVWDI